ncbi:MAG: glycosyltransferase family 4 protein [Candidatus Bathyarchaeia archaeon]
MIICVLAAEFIPAWGGAGIYYQELVKHLPKTCEIHVVTPERKAFGANEQTVKDELSGKIGSNVHVHYISTASDTFSYNAAFQYACLKHVPKLLKQEKIELVHTSMSHMPDLLLRLRTRSVPTIVTLHNTIKVQRSSIKLSGQPFNSLGGSEKAVCLLYPALSLIEELYLWSVNRYIATSQWIKEEALRLSSIRRNQADRIILIPNSVDVDECKKTSDIGREKLKESFAGKRMVLYSGRLLANKGIDVLVDSIPRVLAEVKDKVLFVFAGPGNSAHYAGRLRELGVPDDSFLFTGSISRGGCLELMGCAEVLVLPSFAENCPYAVLEAMACEVPVVASNVGGIPEIIQDGQSGMTFERGNSSDLARKVIALLQDRELNRYVTRAAREVVMQRYSWSANLSKQMQAYEDTISAP